MVGDSVRIRRNVSMADNLSFASGNETELTKMGKSLEKKLLIVNVSNFTTIRILDIKIYLVEFSQKQLFGYASNDI